MDAVPLLEKLVSFDSVFPKEETMARFLADLLRRSGFQANLQEFSPGRFNVLAARGNGTAPILLYAHMDTVPPYGYDKSGRNPFRMEERDGKLYGLGVYDMKAGVAAIIKAVEAAPRDRPLKVLFVSDEEADSAGCHAAAKSGFLDGVAFAVSTEMSDVSDIGDSARTITLGRRGRAQYEIDVPGRSAHAARMEQGISAISEASTLALEIEKMNASMPRHPQLSKGDVFVRKFFSESVSLSLPSKAVLIVDRHLVLPEDAESTAADMQKRVDALYRDGLLHDIEGRKAGVRLVPREAPYMLPYAISAENPHVKRLDAAILDVLGEKARHNYGLTVADENMIAMHGVPVVTYGPIGGREHSCEEWVSKKSYLELIDVLKRFIS
ncbi:MAG: M20/M25/M40 family metallo-hydrolase [Candidatus Micrarchaeota archaeon]